MNRIKLSVDSLAMLLFCAQLKGFKETPLSIEEWNLVEKTIKIKRLRGPGGLLSLELDELTNILEIDEFIAFKMNERMKAMNKFLSLIYNLEANGINITTKYEDDYPSLLLTTLKKKAPLYLFYSGDVSIVQAGISISGTEIISKKDRLYIKRLVDKAFNENLIYISSDTLGCDDVALRYTLQQGGRAVLFVCDRLCAKVKDYTKYIKNRQLIILSHEDPFNYLDANKVVERDTLVSVMSKYQFVISCDINSGAVWFSTLQNLHNDWSIVLAIDNQTLGNNRLLEMGVIPLHDSDILCDDSFEEICLKNECIMDNSEENIDQMSIFEFIGE